jgi:hypothetical protein
MGISIEQRVPSDREAGAHPGDGEPPMLLAIFLTVTDVYRVYALDLQSNRFTTSAMPAASGKAGGGS